MAEKNLKPTLGHAISRHLPPESTEKDLPTSSSVSSILGTRTYVLTGLPGLESSPILHYDPSSQRLVATDGLSSERTIYLVPSQFLVTDQSASSLSSKLQISANTPSSTWETLPVIDDIRSLVLPDNLPKNGQILKSNLGYYFLPNSKEKEKGQPAEKASVAANKEIETELEQVEVCEELVVPDITTKDGQDVINDDDCYKCKDCGVVILCTHCKSHELDVLKPGSCVDSSSDEGEDSGDDNITLSTKEGSSKKKTASSGPLHHCPMCVRSFRTRLALIGHKKKHRKDEKNFACFICTLRFRFEKNYLSHLATHNPNYKQIKGEEKGESVLDGTDKDEGNAANGGVKKKGRAELPKVCHICKKVLKTRKSLRDHIILHSSLRPFSCDVCGRGFPSRRLMRRHKIAHCVTERKHICTECGERFRRPGSLRMHMASHMGIKPYECDVCQMRFNSSSHLSRHKKSHLGIRPYVCPECERAFFSKHHMQRHILTVHLKEKRYSCEQCDKRFPTMSHLQQHSVTHSTTRSFQCDHCDMSFTCKAYKKKHMNSTHSVNKSFHCDMCPLSFSSNYHLKRHKMTHSGSKPFVCEQCGIGFLTKYALQRHTAVHTGLKPFQCEQCPATFAFSERLKQHMLTHTQEKPFCCHICGARFNLKCSLDQHTRKHTGEQPFVCSLCNRKFSSRSSLSRHRRVHTGARPYPCEVCGKGLSSRRALKRHYLTHPTKSEVIQGSNLLTYIPTSGAQPASDSQPILVPMQVLQGQFFFETVEPKLCFTDDAK